MKFLINNEIKRRYNLYDTHRLPCKSKISITHTALRNEQTDSETVRPLGYRPTG